MDGARSGWRIARLTRQCLCMTQTPRHVPRWRKALYILVGLAAVAGMVVGLLVLNDRENRERPMYHDTLLMAGLQWDLLESGGRGVRLSIDADSGPVLVGVEPFYPLPGVSLVVEKREGEFCVQGSNQYGDETEWICVDGTGTRPSLGTLEDEFDG
jgi:hypothetical protein